MLVLNFILGIFGGQELILVLIIVLVLFGGTKIPQLMRGLGKGVSEFKKAKDGVYDEVEDATKESNTKNDKK